MKDTCSLEPSHNIPQFVISVGIGFKFFVTVCPIFSTPPPSPFPTSARLLNPEWATFVSSKEAITLRQDLLAAIFQHLHLWAAYLTPHMITGTICQHSHLFLLCREALWPDESKMLPASNKCSTFSPVTKHYKCSVPENGNATSCPKPKLQTPQLTERV